MAELVTLSELKTALGIALTDTSQDTLLTQANKSASQAILNYTDRDFGAATVTEDRTYHYWGTGILDIDDCTVVNSVSLGSPLASGVWIPMPHRGPVYYWLEGLPYYHMQSTEMGFAYNLDTWVERYGDRRPIEATVNATWGYTPVPDDVKQTVFWTVEFMARDPAEGSRGLSSESIAEYSRTWAITPELLASGLPARVTDILNYYRRVSL